MRSPVFALLFSFALATLVACGSQENTVPDDDDGGDAAADASGDTSLDVGEDVVEDAPQDTTADGNVDVQPDPDVSPDPDAEPDIIEDVALDTPSDAVPDVPTDTAGICVENRDCVGGQLCLDGLCRDVCAADDDCEAPTPVCAGTPAICSECRDDGDCDGRSACVSGTCEPRCVEDADCAGGQVCRLEFGTCDEIECTENGECAGGQICAHGACVEIGDVTCDAGFGECQGNTLVVCVPEGTGFVEIGCGDSASCVEDGDEAGCVDHVCEPSARSCADSGTAIVCSADGTSEEEIECSADSMCVDGSCIIDGCEVLPEDCPPTAPIVDPEVCECVRCARDSDCESGQECTAGGSCVFSEGPCDSASDCTTVDFCRGGECVECLGAIDCGGDPCVAGVCRSCDCGPDEWCDELSICQMCDCPDGFRCLADGSCVEQGSECSSDADCVALAMMLGGDGTNARCDEDGLCYTAGSCGSGTGGGLPGGTDPFESMCPAGLTCAMVFFSPTGNACTGCTSDDQCRPGETCDTDPLLMTRYCGNGSFPFP